MGRDRAIQIHFHVYFSHKLSKNGNFYPIPIKKICIVYENKLQLVHFEGS
ncbi:hypothetical protein LEP1GSC202_0486 [Leptospira yanagawae serovar Saopaulo str. Sao Paulo = ATCC 700523]|uniref:Uncharacterized protein n=1 Tax=Leptospira yanagawae serovar Saopaulo str. Sao Paulo = ATCC 700523 TaxID=1249483 RepID=A0A5E8HG36_9LEPT|nr:hypothetical protein LEP1GSC202_0486 [Leptospira yanagawae serovar Saopaulo str. Sao Paulo = ATCC 700523]